MEVEVMLCQFTVRNYKSIREEMTFDMQATAIMEHRDSVIQTEFRWRINLYWLFVLDY